MGDITIGTPWTSLSPPNIPSLAQLETDINAATLTSDAISKLGLSSYNVKYYGAVGDNSVDDTDAIQAAIDAAEAAGGGVVFFPPGTYRINATLVVEGDDIEVAGAGRYTTTVRQNDGANLTTMIRFGVAADGTGGQQYNRNTIRDIGFNGNKANNTGTIDTDAVLFTRVANATAKRLYIVNAPGNGLTMGQNTIQATPATNKQGGRNLVCTDIVVRQPDYCGVRFLSIDVGHISDIMVDYFQVASGAVNAGAYGVVWDAWTFGNNATGGYGECNAWAASNITVKDGPKGGIYIGASKYFQLSNVVIETPGANAGTKDPDSVGILLGEGAWVAAGNTYDDVHSVKNGSISNVSIRDPEGNAIEATAASNVRCVTIQNVDLGHASAFASGKHGIKLAGSQDVVLSHILVGDPGNGSIGISEHAFTFAQGTRLGTGTFDCERITISDCIVDGHGEAGSGGHGVNADYVAGLLVNGCTFKSENTTSANGSFDIAVTANATGVVIRDCMLYPTDSTQGISVNSAVVDEVSVSGCRRPASMSYVPTVASAASTITLPVEAYDSICTLTGTAAVTGITAAPAGTKVVLISTSTATLVDSGNLKLAGNALGGADDTVTLVCDGTNWFETGRSNN